MLPEDESKNLEMFINWASEMRVRKRGMILD